MNPCATSWLNGLGASIPAAAHLDAGDVVRGRFQLRWLTKHKILPTRRVLRGTAGGLPSPATAARHHHPTDSASGAFQSISQHLTAHAVGHFPVREPPRTGTAGVDDLHVGTLYAAATQLGNASECLAALAAPGCAREDTWACAHEGAAFVALCFPVGRGTVL